jgi:hypothetical protein
LDTTTPGHATARIFPARTVPSGAFVRTVAQSRIDYPVDLDKSRYAGSGCAYSGARTIICNAVSTPMKAPNYAVYDLVDNGTRTP